MKRAHWRPAAVAAGACLTLAVAVPVTASAAPATSRYIQTNLVSDVPGWAQITDPNLVNAWGASFLGGSPLWVSDNGKDVSTLYFGGIHGGTQSIQPLVVGIPGGEPTGQTSNPTSAFPVTASGTTAPALFIFVSESGHITGWNPTVAPTEAQDAIPPTGGIYKGVAMGMAPLGPRLYAANFASGQVEMYNGSWQRVRINGAFRDPRLPKHYGPFNIMVSGNHVYVAYAKQSGGTDEVDGPGLGRVDVFTLGGQLLSRMVHTSALNAPWGMAIAPAGFGDFSGDLLVGNFGDGKINAFTPFGLARQGVVDGLWALLPGNGREAGTDEVIFTAGPADESHGLLGTLRVSG